MTKVLYSEAHLHQHKRLHKQPQKCNSQAQFTSAIWWSYSHVTCVFYVIRKTTCNPLSPNSPIFQPTQFQFLPNSICLHCCKLISNLVIIHRWLPKNERDGLGLKWGTSEKRRLRRDVGQRASGSLAQAAWVRRQKIPGGRCGGGPHERLSRRT